MAGAERPDPTVDFADPRFKLPAEVLRLIVVLFFVGFLFFF